MSGRPAGLDVENGKDRRSGRLSLRIAVPLIAIGVALSGIAALVTSMIFQHELDLQLRRRAEALATAIISAADSAERSGQLMRFVTAVGAERDVDLLLVAAGSPLRVVAANRLAWEDLTVDEIAGSGISPETLRDSEKTVTWRETANSVQLGSPLRATLGASSNRSLRGGVVLVSLDRRPAIEALRSTLFAVLGLEFVVVAGLVGGTLILLRARVLRPLRLIEADLIASTGQSGQTRLISALPNDEIGAIGRSLGMALHDLALLKRAVDAATDAVFITDPTRADAPIVYVNAAYERLTGYPADETIGSPPRLAAQEAASPEVARARAALSEGKDVDVVMRGLRKDGGANAVRLHISPVRTADGRLSACIGILSDVGESLRQEQELRDTKAFLDAIVDALPVAVFCKRVGDQRWVLWNRAAELLFGRTRAEALGRTARDVFPREQADALTARDAAVIAGELAVSVTEEPLMLPPSDQPVWTRTSRVALPGPDGRPAFLLAISEDISERRLAASRLLEAHAEVEELLSILSAILIGIGADGSVNRFNGAAERVFGVPANQVVGRPCEDCGLGLDWQPLSALIRAAIADGRPAELSDVRCATATGGEAFLDLSVIPARAKGSSGRQAVVIVGFDVTARRMAEAQRTHGQKLESIGQLASGIAHEINTPIQFIGDNLRFLADSFRDLWSLHESWSRLGEWARSNGATHIVAEIDRAREALDPDYLAAEMPKAISQGIEGIELVRDIVKAMKDFSHPDQATQRPEDLNQLVLTTLTVARNEYRYVATVVTDLAADLPPVTCLGGELRQVVLNLVVNAAHAIGDADRGPQGLGTITVTTRRIGDDVELRIADTGCGIPAAIRQRVFDPFFTTKEVGRGSGQGLYIAYGIIVKRHGGTIRFESREMVGTTFIITLPISPQLAPHDPSGDGGGRSQ